MEPKFVFYSVNVKEASWMHVSLNDLPLHTQEVPGVDSHSTSINYMLLHGENTLTVEVLRAPEERGDGAVSVQFYRVIDPTTRPMTLEPIHGFSFPEMFVPENAPGRRLPYFHESRFSVDIDGFMPAWVNAEPAQFDCQGTEELRNAVIELHQCVERLDIDKFLDLMDLRLSEYERAHPGVPQARADTRRDALRELFSFKPRIPPLNMADLHFEPRAGGRVAYVTRASGAPVLYAPSELDPRRRLKADLLFTQHRGAWRIWG